MKKFAIATPKADAEARIKLRSTSIKTARMVTAEQRDFMQKYNIFHDMESAKALLGLPPEE